jgi:hypothetical protein
MISSLSEGKLANAPLKKVLYLALVTDEGQQTATRCTMLTGKTL